MLERRIAPTLKQRLADSPAVVLLGPRQVGKTTLALELSEGTDSVYLDMESPADLAMLSEPELYLADHTDQLVIIDEIHRVPGLFPVLRGLVDKGRREGRKNGMYLLLGSASLDLLKQSGETLAGRVSYLELNPFDVLEIDATAAYVDRLWVRGGFPESFLATSEARGERWRMDFIRSYLERDIPQYGPRIAAEQLRRFWTMLAHNQGGILNVAQLARNIGVDVKTAGGYIDLLVDLLLVRRLQPWHSNAGKRLVKSPKVYVRDSGLVHALLGIHGKRSLLAHPVVGGSWEGFVVEQLLAVAPEGVEGYFYRTSAGAEVDLVLRLPDGKIWAIEVKRSLSPKLSPGFHNACEDLKADRRYVVYPGSKSFPLGEGVEVVPLAALARWVDSAQ